MINIMEFNIIVIFIPNKASGFTGGTDPEELRD